MWYFGCWTDPHSKRTEIGHYVRDLYGRMLHGIDRPRFETTFGFMGGDLDGRYCPKDSEEEGRALLHHVNGYTVLAFWDRSGDERGKSNSAFIMTGELTFARMMEHARGFFPQIVERFPFDVFEVSTRSQSEEEPR